jgi:perosamine synthetase
LSASSASPAENTAGAPTAAAVVKALASVARPPAALHEPEIAGNEWTYVKECLDTGWVSSVGSYVDRFEAMIAEQTGARHAIATINGTAALHACYTLAGVEAGDEVIVPTLTFVGTANAVAYLGAIPHFADSEEQTLGLDAAKLEEHLNEIAEPGTERCVNRLTGRPIKAAVVVHLYGHPANLDALNSVCRRFGIGLIEDAAESLGSYYKGRHTGNDGRLAALSFNGNKIVTTGGGGAILTNDDALATAAKHLTTTAKRPHAWAYDHDRVGFNYRMPNINAAMGCAQLERLEDMLERKRVLAERYRQAFVGMPGIGVFSEPADCRSNFWLNTLVLEGADAALRDAILEESASAGLMCRPAWTPMHCLPMFEDCPRMDLSVAEDLYERIINVPSSPALANAELQ